MAYSIMQWEVYMLLSLTYPVECNSYPEHIPVRQGAWKSIFKSWSESHQKVKDAHSPRLFRLVRADRQLGGCADVQG